jgi:hypothetical protein
VAQNGFWAPIYQSLWTHRKTFELAALLGISETYAGAHCARLWTWAIDNAPDGDLSNLSDRAIAYGAGWTQEVSLFVGALLRAGFLDDDRTIHDWDDYAGKLIERREKDAERKQKSRGLAPDVRGTSNGASGLVRRRREENTEEEKRVEETYPTPQPPPPAGEGERRNPRRRSGPVAGEANGEATAPPSEAPLAPPTGHDLALWQLARDAMQGEMSAANYDLVCTLEPAGRGPDGGLRLRAPPAMLGLGRFRPIVARALYDAGDTEATHAAILDAKG